MSQTGVIFASLFVAWIIFVTIRGDAGKWLDIVGL